MVVVFEGYQRSLVELFKELKMLEAAGGLHKKPAVAFVGEPSLACDSDGSDEEDLPTRSTIWEEKVKEVQSLMSSASFESGSVFFLYVLFRKSRSVRKPSKTQQFNLWQMLSLPLCYLCLSNLAS